MPTLLTLNGIALPAALIWSDRENFAPVAQSATRTLGGRMVVEHQGVSAGRPITLASERQQGWVDYATVKSLGAIAETPGGIYTLVVGSETYSVMFRHHEPPAFAAEPLIKRLAPADTDRYTVTIKLITIS